MTSLRLLIDPGWPHEHADCAWFLCDAGGRVLQSGHSEPRHWPGVVAAHGDARLAVNRREAMACDLVLTGGQASCFVVALPKGPAGRRPEVVAAAVEDSLLDAAEDCQLLVEDADDGSGRGVVAAIAAGRLDGLCRMLAELGLAARSAWPDGLLLPKSGGRRCACPSADAFVLPTSGGGFLTLDAAMLEAAGAERLRGLGLGLGLPMPLRAIGEGGRDLPGVFVPEPATADFPYREPPAGGFLHGRFAPPRRRFAASRHFWPALKLAGALAAAAALLVVAEWGWFAFEAKQHREETARLYRQAFPQGALVDPASQMQRQLDGRRRALGKLGAGDFLHLLDGLAKATAANDEVMATIGRLDYQAGRLQVTATLPAAAVEGLLARLRQSGLRCELGSRQESGGQATIAMTLSPGAVR